MSAPRSSEPPRAPAHPRRSSQQRQRPGPSAGLGGDQVEGRRAVRELLAAGRRPVRGVWMAQGLEPSRQLDEIESLAAAAHVRVEVVSGQRFDREARTRVPQGVLARARSIVASDLEELAVSGDRGIPFLVVVAGVTDPQNLGALLRSAECAGATGVVLPRHRSVHLSPTVTKVAAGAVEHLDFALVGGIPSALERLSRLGFRSFGLASEAPLSLHALDLSDGPVALVVGGEERGLPPLVRKRCDAVVSIPQRGALESLNAGVAAAIACFEVSRQRLGGAEPARLRPRGRVGRLSR